MTSNKNKKNQKKSSSQDFSFEEQEDPAEMLRAHLDAFEPPRKDVDELVDSPRLKSKKKKNIQLTVDLHGQTVAEARESCDRLLNSIAGQGEADIKIITGKGRHSGAQGPTLISEIYDYIAKKYQNQIIRIDPPPANDRIDGLPLKGFFDLKFKR